MTPTDSDDCTQPQVLSWGVLEVYNKTKDVEFLRECVDALDAYLTWDMKNRDKNGNGLLEWATEPDNVLSKCGESGLDNSPRFDFDKDIDAIDEEIINKEVNRMYEDFLTKIAMQGLTEEVYLQYANLTKEIVEQTIPGDVSEDEQLYFERFDYMKDTIAKAFPEMGVDYAEYITEKKYSEYFE